MSSEIAIRVENLSKFYQIYDKPRDRLKQLLLPGIQRTAGLKRKQYFREFWALKNISFKIGKGETVGIIGRNGSGKSTLLQIICGTLDQSVGEITTAGRIAALLELGSGFNPEFTGRENVYMNASVLGLTKREIDSRLQAITDFSEIGEFIDQPVKTYSSGMHARLAFSIAINVDPEILIVDEALAVGDARFVAKCMRRIKEIQQNGASILFVSHDVSSVRTLCERAIWLDKGVLIEQGDVFPVTGRFTEFMFRDESRADPASPHNEALRPEVTPPTDPTSLAGSSALSVVSPPHPLSQQSPVAIDARPVTHWGSHKGIITAAGIQDAEGNRCDSFEWGNPLCVFVELNVPKDISREHLSVAFSIKDLKGTDLLASATHELQDGDLPENERFRVSFKLTNQLVSGKYLLVVAVESRQHHDIHYHEYIEGAQYFASLANERFFGIFHPPIEQQIIA